MPATPRPQSYASVSDDIVVRPRGAPLILYVHIGNWSCEMSPADPEKRSRHLLVAMSTYDDTSASSRSDGEMISIQPDSIHQADRLAWLLAVEVELARLNSRREYETVPTNVTGSSSSCLDQ